MSHNRIDAHRPVATKVIDGDSYTVELDLSPIAAGLLSDIALALRGNGHLMTLLANTKPGTWDHAKTRQVILQRLEMTSALKLTLGPDQAEQLAGDLFDAMEEPARCEGACGGENYAVYDGLCVDDDAARSLANASAGGRL